jgi:hypothetical protein
MTIRERVEALITRGDYPDGGDWQGGRYLLRRDVLALADELDRAAEILREQNVQTITGLAALVREANQGYGAPKTKP